MPVKWVFLAQIWYNDDDNNFYEDDPGTIIHVRLLASHNKFENPKVVEKDLSKELMPVAWHPTIWWDWCMSEDETKETDPTFTDKVGRY